MTTAHRPTFDPARGSDDKAPTLSVSAHALPAHTKLKFRHENPNAQPITDREVLRRELLQAEQAHFAKARSEAAALVFNHLDETSDEEEETSHGRKAIEGSANEEERRKRLMEQAKRLDRDSEHSSSSESEHSSSDDDETSDDDDEEDDTEELLRELEKIKRERAEEKRRQEAEAAEDAERARQEQLLSGNPLLNQKPHDFSVKRRWDDDVVFRNQAKGVDDKPKKRFVNDLIRSDFHRKFMEKYVR